MLLKRSALAFSILLLAALPPAGSAAAQTLPNDDSAEVALWQTIRGSRNPADFQEFLLLYPRGQLSPLARIQLERLGGTPAPTPAETPVVDPVPALPELNHLEVTPGVVGMGQTVTVHCRGFMPPALYDQMVVVRVGTPDFDASGNIDRTQLLWTGLPNLYDCAGAGINLPMFLKGAYEVRYVSRQYNPNGTLEIVARSGFVYR